MIAESIKSRTGIIYSDVDIVSITPYAEVAGGYSQTMYYKVITRHRDRLEEIDVSHLYDIRLKILIG